MDQYGEFEEPNYTQVPNELLGNYTKRQGWTNGLMAEMGEAELRVVLAIIRATLGFHRAHARVSLRDLAKLTGMSTNGVQAGATAAEERGLVLRFKDGGVTFWQLNAPWLEPEWKCPLCGESFSFVEATPPSHHIIPSEYGGPDGQSNRFTLCQRCHSEVHERYRYGLEIEEPTDEFFRREFDNFCASVSNSDTRVSNQDRHPVYLGETPSKKQKERKPRKKSPTPSGAGGKENHEKEDSVRGGSFTGKERRDDGTQREGHNGSQAGDSSVKGKAGPTGEHQSATNRQHRNPGTAHGQSRDIPRQDAEATRRRVARALARTITQGEDDPVPKSELVTYINQQFHREMSDGKINKLALGYTEIAPTGNTHHPSPNELWDTHPEFKRYVAERVEYFKTSGKYGTVAQKQNACVNLICAFKGDYAWLDWLEKRRADSPIDRFTQINTRAYEEGGG